MIQGRKELQVEITTVKAIITLPYYKFMFKDQNPQCLRLGLIGMVTTKDAPRKEHFTILCLLLLLGWGKKAVMSAGIPFVS